MATTTPVIRSFSSDSGTLGDGITNDNILMLTGTAAANSTVKVYDGTTLLGSTTADSSGAWSYTTGTLSNGTHGFTATTTDTSSGGSSGGSSPPSGFPDASTTGVTAGTSLTTVKGDFTSSYAGQVIDALNVTGTIVINHPGVIVRNCQAGQIVANADGVTIEYCDVKSNGTGNSGIVLLFSDNSTVRGCDVSGYENSIWLEASGCTIKDNYIHDPIPYNPATDPHIDGIQSPSTGGVANNLIQHNNIDMGPDSNSCITGGGASNITIDGNRLNGGTYTIYFGDDVGCKVTNNVFVTHQFGYVNGDPQTYSGNIDAATGRSLVPSGGDLVLGTGTASTALASGSTTQASSGTTLTSAPLSVTIDTVAPKAPTIVASTPTSNHVEVLSGTAEAGSTVKVFDGTTQIGTATANASGAWSYTTAALPTGSHSFTAKAMDAAGNTGAASTAAVVNIAASTPAPAAPTIASFSNDSGVAGDHITNNNTLTLSGTAAANSTVKVFDGSTQVGTATANASGAWSLTTSTLVNGGHSLTATATTSGGTSSASAPFSVTIDTVAPNAPTIVASTPTSNHVEVLTGTAEAGSTVKVFDGTTQIGTATANASGAWSYTTAALPTGSHSFTAKAMDAAGNTGAASKAAVVNITAPTPAPAAPTIASFSNDSGVAGDHITNNNTLTLSGTAAANSTVKVFDGSTQVGTATANASGAWSLTTSTLVNGGHSLTATATTSGGTSSASAPFSVTIDTVAPNAPTIVASTPTSSHVEVLTGTAEANSTVKVFDGTTQIGTATANASGDWSYTTTALSTGSHSFTAKAMDVAGNTGAASTAAAVNITASTPAPAAPTITSFSNDSGVAGDHVTNDNTLTLSGTAAANSTVKIFDGSTQVGTATANSSGAWSYTTGTLSNGTHGFTATTTDTSSGGGSGGSSPPSGFPDASTTGVTAGTSLTTVKGDFTSSYAGQVIDALNVTGTIIINHPGVIVRNCQAGQIVANADGATIEYCDVKSNGTGNSGIVLLFSDNSTVRGCDVSGYENSIWLEASGCTIKDNYIHNPIPYNPATDPHVDGIQSPSTGGVANNLIQHNNIDMGPDSNSCITGGGASNITIDGNRLNGGTYTIYFGDNVDGKVTNNVFVTHQFGYVDGDPQTYSGNIDAATGRLLVPSGGDLVLSTSKASTALASGSTTQASSGTTLTSAPLSVTIDTVAPKAPTIAASTPTSTHVEVLSGTAEAGSTVKVFDGTTQIGTATANASGAWSYTTAALPTGSHSFTAKAMDAAGNTGAASTAAVVNITATTPAPAAPTIASFSNDSGVAGDHITNDNTLKLTGTAAANSTVKVFDGTTQIGTATANAGGSWEYITSVLNDAVHLLTATATDSAGHTSASSAALSVTIDTHGPAAPTMGVYSQTGSTVGSTTMLDDFVLKGIAEANSTVKVFDGANQVGTATANDSGAWSFDTGHLDTGNHSFTSKAVDAAGNIGSASAPASVAITAPSAPSADVEITNLLKSWIWGVTVSGTADPSSTVKLYDGAKALGSATADSDGTWTYTAKWGLSNTVHTLTAQEVGATGNVVAKGTGAAILGSSGNNTLTSTAGDDVFVGNGGSDTFVFNANFGKDVIKDFDASGRSHDTLQFSKSVFDSFASVLSHASQVGQDVVISAGADTLTLKNTKLSTLDSHDFHFA